MAEPQKNPHSAPVITDAKAIDITAAELRSDLSRTGIDSDNESFYATTDRLFFQTILEITQKVLESQKFVVNLENILACFDQMSIGAAVKLEAGSTIATAALPALCFQLPQRQRAGALLQLFYREIASFEQELKTLRAKVQSDENQGPAANLALAEAELTRLRREQQSLRQERDDLLARLRALSARASAATSMGQSPQDLPLAISPAVVQSHHWEDRSLLLKSGRGLHKVYMAELNALPAIGTACLYAHLIGAVMFYAERLAPPTLHLATILQVDDKGFRCRDQRRQLHIFLAMNPVEQQLLSHLVCGGSVALAFAGDRLIRWEALPKDEGAGIVAAVRAESAYQQLKTSRKSEAA